MDRRRQLFQQPAQAAVRHRLVRHRDRRQLVDFRDWNPRLDQHRQEVGEIIGDPPGEAFIGRQRTANIRKTLLTILREAKFPLMTAQVRDRLARRVKQDAPTKLVLRHLNALAEIGSATKGKKSPREVYWRANGKAR